jgi:protein tyrosine phosphatase (PTP) superfamily phosphohydrolase (DUF442 family)
MLGRNVAVALVVLSASARADAPRPGTWAARLERPGLPNLHRVSAALYRGAQPTAEGMKQLAALGVKTVVNLRNHHSDEKALAGTGLAYVSIPMDAWSVKTEHVVRFLQVVSDPARQPVFVHCQHGADRTGTLVAAYRMTVLGWSAEDAIREMVDGGFGYHSIWRGLRTFLRTLDVKAVHALAGLAPKPN